MSIPSFHHPSLISLHSGPSTIPQGIGYKTPENRGNNTSLKYLYETTVFHSTTRARGLEKEQKKEGSPINREIPLTGWYAIPSFQL